MFTLTKLNVLWDKVKALEARPSGSNIPDPSEASDGQVLMVDDGVWGIGNIPDELPDPSGASDGQVLMVDDGAWGIGTVSSGGYNISSSEVATGNTFNNQPIYCKLFTGNYYLNGNNIDIGEVGDISVLSITFLSHDGWACPIRGRRYSNTGHLTADYMGGIPDSYSEAGDILVYYYYNPQNEAKTTRKKSTK